VSWYYWALMAGQCLFFMGVCYFYRALPSLDHGHVERLKRIFYNVIVNAKYGLAGIETTFDFQYTVTDMGKPREIKLKSSGVELRNLRTLGIFFGVLGIGTYVGIRVASGLVKMVS
jgi:hypothetical protein